MARAASSDLVRYCREPQAPHTMQVSRATDGDDSE